MTIKTCRAMWIPYKSLFTGQIVVSRSLIIIKAMLDC
jgi:hypothetical protein